MVPTESAKPAQDCQDGRTRHGAGELLQHNLRSDPGEGPVGGLIEAEDLDLVRCDELLPPGVGPQLIGDELLDARGVLRRLDLDVHPGLHRGDLRGVVQMRDAFAGKLGTEVGSGVELLQFIPGEGRDRVAGAVREDLFHVGGPGGSVVVEQERHAIGAELDVDFEEVGTGGAAVLKRGHRVLRRRAGGTAVADQQRSFFLPGLVVLCAVLRAGRNGGEGGADGNGRDGASQRSDQARCHGNDALRRWCSCGSPLRSSFTAVANLLANWL